mmetsp:Transcript_38898/g.111158  ORF Transcript_38898/g.111158 Transcript_38898/m.111158 type:complete len:370 (+) Transcript_38898:935-2044(+)
MSCAMHSGQPHTHTHTHIQGWKQDFTQSGRIAACSCVAWVQKLLDNPFPICERTQGTGVWRLLMVRMSKATQEMLVVVQVLRPADEAALSSLKSQLVASLVGQDPSRRPLLYDDIPVTSLFLQYRSAVSDATDSPTDQMERLYGKDHILMGLLGLRFRVAPLAFFQTNTVSCELLYQRAIDWLCLSDDKPTILLDVCCGTGTIGLCAAKQHPSVRVVGIESNEEAVQNAIQNAQANGISNARFVAGKAEDVIGQVIEQMGGDAVEGMDVCAVVDPPRAGLHSTVLNALKGCQRVRRLVYVSCNPESLNSNVIELCSPSTSAGKGEEGSLWVPTKACAVDMFPHTMHVEAVVAFERLADMTTKTGTTHEN